MRKTLITGFILFIPLALTLYFINFTLDLAALPFKKLATLILDKEFLKRHFDPKNHALVIKVATKFLAVFFLLLTSAILGFLARFTFRKYLIDAPLEWIKQLPVIGPIIRLTADVSQRVLGTETLFKETALVPFFTDDKFMIGLVTSLTPPPFCPKKLALNRTVFIPTSPHPVSGFLILTKEELIEKISLSSNEALSIVISCGASGK